MKSERDFDISNSLHEMTNQHDLQAIVAIDKQHTYASTVCQCETCRARLVATGLMLVTEFGKDIMPPQLYHLIGLLNEDGPMQLQLVDRIETPTDDDE